MKLKVLENKTRVFMLIVQVWFSFRTFWVIFRPQFLEWRCLVAMQTSVGGRGGFRPGVKPKMSWVGKMDERDLEIQERENNDMTT